MTDSKAADSFHDKEGFYKGTCWGATLTVNLGMVLAGYIGGVLNTIQAYVSTNVFHWDTEEAVFYGGLMNSVLCGGGAAGTLAGGVLAKTFGRRNTMIIADIIGAIGALFTTLAIFPLFLCGRALIGFAGGVNCTVVPLYVNEVNPLPLRGPTGSVIQGAASFGTLAALILGYGMPQDNSPTIWWRFMIALPIAFCLLRTALITTIFNIEPAKFLLTKGRKEEAEQSLRRIYHEMYVQEQITAISMEIAQSSSSAKEMKISDLFTPRWRYRFLLGIFVAASPQLTFVTGISFYSTILFKKTTGDQFKAQTLTCIMMACTLVANLFAGGVISKVGRKSLLLSGALLSALLWGSVTIFMQDQLDNVAQFPFFIFFIVFGLTYGPVPWIYVAEVLPDVAIGIALFLNYGVQVIVAQIFPVIINSLPVSGFLIPGGITIGVFLIVLAFLKETKDKTPQEISELFNQGDVHPDAMSKGLIVGNNATGDGSKDGTESEHAWV